MSVEEAYNTLFIARIRKKATINERGCWLINTSLDYDGYYIGSYRGKAVRAHKKIYIITHGEIPKGLVTDHLCKNRNCCNPDHLEIVTNLENIRRGKSFNGSKTHCKNGHKYTPDNTYLDSKGHRHCNTCRYEANKKARAKRMERDNKDKV